MAPTTNSSDRFTAASKAVGNLTAIAGVKFADSYPQRSVIRDRDAAALDMRVRQVLGAYAACAH